MITITLKLIKHDIAFPIKFSLAMLIVIMAAITRAVLSYFSNLIELLHTLLDREGSKRFILLQGD